MLLPLLYIPVALEQSALNLLRVKDYTSRHECNC